VSLVPAYPSVPSSHTAAIKWEGQSGQDIWAFEALGKKEGGFFVEFGAGDGVKLFKCLLCTYFHSIWNRWF
jgi:hypothetical protein